MNVIHIVRDLFDPTRIANRYIIGYAIGTFGYGIGITLFVLSVVGLVRFPTLMETIGIAFLLFGLIVVGPCYSAIMRGKVQDASRW